MYTYICATYAYERERPRTVVYKWRYTASSPGNIPYVLMHARPHHAYRVHARKMHATKKSARERSFEGRSSTILLLILLLLHLPLPCSTSSSSLSIASSTRCFLAMRDRSWAARIVDYSLRRGRVFVSFLLSPSPCPVRSLVGSVGRSVGRSVGWKPR